MRRIAFAVLFLLSMSCSRNATQVATTATDDALATGPTTVTTTSAPAEVAQKPKAAATSVKTSKAQAVVPARE